MALNRALKEKLIDMVKFTDLAQHTATAAAKLNANNRFASQLYLIPAVSFTLFGHLTFRRVQTFDGMLLAYTSTYRAFIPPFLHRASKFGTKVNSVSEQNSAAIEDLIEGTYSLSNASLLFSQAQDIMNNSTKVNRCVIIDHAIDQKKFIYCCLGVTFCKVY